MQDTGVGTSESPESIPRICTLEEVVDALCALCQCTFVCRHLSSLSSKMGIKLNLLGWKVSDLLLETKAQSGQMFCPRSQSWSVVECRSPFTVLLVERDSFKRVQSTLYLPGAVT